MFFLQNLLLKVDYKLALVPSATLRHLSSTYTTHRPLCCCCHCWNQIILSGELEMNKSGQATSKISDYSVYCIVTFLTILIYHLNLDNLPKTLSDIRNKYFHMYFIECQHLDIQLLLVSFGLTIFVSSISQHLSHPVYASINHISSSTCSQGKLYKFTCSKF